MFRRANRGNHIAFATPGVNLILAGAGSPARPQSGTSLATPFVTAAAALALAAGTERGAVVQRLRRKATDLGPPARRWVGSDQDAVRMRLKLIRARA